MSEIATDSSISTSPSKLCHLCRRADGHQVAFSALPEDLQKLVQANLTTSEVSGQVCAKCVSIFTRAQRKLKFHPDIFSDGHHALPTPLRMDADERFTGRG